MNSLNGYELSRAWFDFSFENPEKIKPSHGILYFFIIEHCNRLGWKDKFGLPTTMAKEAIGIRSYNTYINTLNDLVDWGFIEMVEKSKNQYSSNIVAISKFNKALDKALDKALIKHGTKQRESIDSINKQLTSKQRTIPSFDEFKVYGIDKKPLVDLSALKNKYDAWVESGWCIERKGKLSPILIWKTTLSNTLTFLPEKPKEELTSAKRLMALSETNKINNNGN